MTKSTAVSTFKGHVVLNITDPNSNHPFAIGLRKARLILANLDAVKAFVESQSAKPKTAQKAVTTSEPDAKLIAAVIAQLKKPKTETKTKAAPKATQVERIVKKQKSDVNEKNLAVINAVLRKNGVAVNA